MGTDQATDPDPEPSESRVICLFSQHLTALLRQEVAHPLEPTLACLGTLAPAAATTGRFPVRAVTAHNYRICL